MRASMLTIFNWKFVAFKMRLCSTSIKHIIWMKLAPFFYSSNSVVHGHNVPYSIGVDPMNFVCWYIVQFHFQFWTAIHNWHGNVQHGLELDVGDSVEIVEECPQWYRGTSSRKPRLVGIFPKSYIHIKDLSKVDAVVAECTQVLREWSEIWKRLYVVSITK